MAKNAVLIILKRFPKEEGVFFWLVALFLIAVIIYAYKDGENSSQSLPLLTPPTHAWPMYQGMPSHNAVFGNSVLRVQWSADLHGKINGGLSVVGNTIYAVSFDHRLYALDLRTGEVRWAINTTNVLMSTPVVDRGTVVVGSGHNGFLRPDDWTSQTWGRPSGDDVMAFSLDKGKPRWLYHTPGEDMPSAAIVGEQVLFANGDLHAYSLDLRNGKLVWQSDISGVDSMSSASVDHGKMFIGMCHNAPRFCETRAIDIRDGRTIWKSPYGGSDCSPTVADGLVFVDGNAENVQQFRPGGRDIVAALDEDTGRKAWEHQSPAGPYALVASGQHYVAGTVAGGILYQSISNMDKIVAFKASTGRVLWSFQTLAPVKMSPVVTRERIYFGDISGVFYDVARTTGRLIQTTSFDEPFSASPPVVVGRTLFVANGQFLLAVPTELI